MFYKENKPFVKVCDFGLGKNTESLTYYTKSSASGYGQVLYVSPEQRVQLNDATVKSDIYSLGKLVYFIFTGKDPDNLKPFELSSLVTKATEENPENRFQNIEEFEAYFNALKDLQLNQEIPIEYITLHDIITANEDLDFIKLHELLLKGNYIDHVYHDYISPTISYLSSENNLREYYQYAGIGIRDFVKTFAERLDECYNTTRWPFSAMNTFGKFLKKIIKLVEDDETRLICLKHLWSLAFESDQWAVQKEIKELLTEKYISKGIETQLSEHIIASESEVEISFFSGIQMPRIIKIGIIKARSKAIARKEELERKWKEEHGEDDW